MSKWNVFRSKHGGLKFGGELEVTEVWQVVIIEKRGFGPWTTQNLVFSVEDADSLMLEKESRRDGDKFRYFLRQVFPEYGELVEYVYVGGFRPKETA